MGENLWDNVWDINIINGIIWLIINRYGVWLLISGWWLTYPSEKYANSSVGNDDIPNIYGINIQIMFQTTNQNNKPSPKSPFMGGMVDIPSHGWFMTLFYPQKTDDNLLSR